MKKSITSLELHYLIKELQELVNARVDKIYNPEQSLLFIQFFISSQGKKLLKINPPHYLYLTEHKIENPDKPSDFCLMLRKHLDNSFVRSVSQKDSERIVEIVFEKKDEKCFLIIELFSKGNVMICDRAYKIILPLSVQKLRERTLKKDEIYNIPHKTKNLFSITQEEFTEAIKNSVKESLVKTLAIELGLGGSYAEELCLVSTIDKNKKSVTEKDIELLYNHFLRLLAQEAKPAIVYDQDKNLVDIIPVELASYANYTKEYFKTYCEALDFGLKQEIVSKEEKQLRAKMEKLTRIIEQQKTDITEMEKKLEIDQKAADLLFHNYQLISEIIDEIKKATVKYSWREIQEKLNGHKIVKDVNTKDKMLVLELE